MTKTIDPCTWVHAQRKGIKSIFSVHYSSQTYSLLMRTGGEGKLHEMIMPTARVSPRRMRLKTLSNIYVYTQRRQTYAILTKCS